MSSEKVVDENGNVAWYVDGKLHREDGPAVEWADGTNEYWWNGRRLKLHAKPGNVRGQRASFTAFLRCVELLKQYEYPEKDESIGGMIGEFGRSFVRHERKWDDSVSERKLTVLQFLALNPEGVRVFALTQYIGDQFKWSQNHIQNARTFTNEILGLMERQGLVIRKKHCQTKVDVAITQKGLESMREAEAERKSFFDGAMSGLSETDLKDLRRILKKINANVSIPEE